MARQKISGGPPVVDKPLGQATDEEREAIIAESQNAAIAKAREAALKTLESKVTTAPVDRGALAGLFGGEAAKVVESVAAAQATLKVDPQAGHALAPGVTAISLPSVMQEVMAAACGASPASAEDGDEVTVTHPEEMYGMKGSYSSYRVGPCVLKAKVRPGQTRRQVQEQLRAELAEFMAAERARAKAAFMKHLAVAFEG